MENETPLALKRQWYKKKSILLILLTIALFILVFGALYMINMSQANDNTTIISSQKKSITPLSPSPTTLVASREAKMTDIESQKKTDQITIALFGDSMIDTMGDEVDALSLVLERKYPDVAFTFYNYGIGAQNVEQGLLRFDNPYVYKERNFPSIAQLKPDILIIGSFSYNPFNPHDSTRHVTALSSLLSNAKQINSDLYLLVEIAPLSTDFGKGEKGLNWSDQAASEHALKIVENLESSLRVAKSIGVTLIDAYTESRTADGVGIRSYVNSDDGIHPSYEGHLYTADQIAKTVKIK